MELVGSAGHQWVKPEFFDLEVGGKGVIEQASAREFFEPKRVYCVGKLFVMYIMEGLMQEMAKNKTDSEGSKEEEENGEVVVLTTCTGLCRTNLGRDFGIVAKVFNNLFQLVFARTAEQGSRSIVSGAALGRKAMGGFWSHDVFFR